MYFDWLAYVVAAVEDRVGQRLFDGCKRKWEEAVCLRPIGMLHYALEEERSLNVCERLTELLPQRSNEPLLPNLTGLAVGKVHNVDLRLREESVWSLAEEEEPDVARPEVFGWPVNDLHLLTQTCELHRAGRFEKLAPHLLQVRLG